MSKSNTSGIIFHPFWGYHPSAEWMEKMACPPYDVIESDEARIMAKGNERSFLRVEKPEIDLPSTVDLYDDAVYHKGKENMDLFIKNKWLIHDEKPYFYIYSQEMKIPSSGKTHIQYGIAGEVNAKQYEDKLIKKHELTRPKKEDDRTRLTNIQSANASPVFLCYRGVEDINKIVKDYTTNHQPYSKFATSDGVKHCLWIITDEKIINSISQLFDSKVPCLYVADGHHRTASAWRVYKERRAKLEKENKYTGQEAFNNFLAVVFPAEQLNILDYNRVVLTLNNLSPDEFLKQLDTNWTYEPLHVDVQIETPEERESKSDTNTSASSHALRINQPHEYRMYLYSKGWFVLKPKSTVIKKVEKDPIKCLDVSVLSDFLLDPILSIKDLRTDERIHFVGGIHGFLKLQEKVEKNKGGVAFGLYPTSTQQLMTIADAGEIMPPKSTWFEPKLKSGVIVRTF